MKWFGYVLVNRVLGMTQAVKDEITAISCGVGDQCTKTAFNCTIINDRALIRIEMDKQGTDLINAFDTLGVDSYIIYGDTEYPENEIKQRFKTSVGLAYVYFSDNVLLFQVD
jgi:hypothetical protein